jgi:four helix bundle protein
VAGQPEVTVRGFGSDGDAVVTGRPRPVAMMAHAGFTETQGLPALPCAGKGNPEAGGRFPSTGYGKFKTQITAAAESIASNIVEGAGAPTKKEFARFLDISIRSSLELEYRMELALDYGLFGHALWERLTQEVTEIRKMLFGLRKRVLGDE